MPLAAAIEPAYRSIPAYAFTSGPEVADLCDFVNYGPDANQRMVLDAIFAENDQGRPAAFEVAIICSRQNLKTAIMKQASLGWLFLTKARRIVYTAHDWNPACADMFKDMKELVEGSSWLSQRVKRIYEGNGEESIDLKTGQQMLFKTRTKSGGRAMAGDKLLFDEGFALQHTHTGSLIPILSTRPEAQIVYGSSPGKAESEVLRDVRDRGRAYVEDAAMADPSLAYFDWCAPAPAQACDLGEACDHGRNTAGCGCDKREMVQLANPAAPHRITFEYIEKERRALSPAEFGRERMGWWDDPSAVADAAIDITQYDDIVDDDPEHAPETVDAYAVDVSPDRSTASIGMAARRGDGRLHFEWIETRAGVDWVIPRLLELEEEFGAADVALDGKGGARHLIEKMQDAGLVVIVLTTEDVIAACAQMVDGIRDHSYVHGPQPELRAAVEGARWRPAGDGGSAFGRRRSDIDITPLYAVAFAAWAAGEETGPNVW